MSFRLNYRAHTHKNESVHWQWALRKSYDLPEKLGKCIKKHSNTHLTSTTSVWWASRTASVWYYFYHRQSNAWKFTISLQDTDKRTNEAQCSKLPTICEILFYLDFFDMINWFCEKSFVFFPVYKWIQGNVWDVFVFFLIDAKGQTKKEHLLHNLVGLHANVHNVAGVDLCR